MLKENHQSLEGNDKYEGYCIDLLKEISKILGFKFQIKLVGDRKYGEKNDQGDWNGMIKELIDGVGGIRYCMSKLRVGRLTVQIIVFVPELSIKIVYCLQRADVAIADLTITFEREQAVDFTMPFMNLGISILFRKPTKKVRDISFNCLIGTVDCGSCLSI